MSHLRRYTNTVQFVGYLVGWQKRLFRLPSKLAKRGVGGGIVPNVGDLGGLERNQLKKLREKEEELDQFLAAISMSSSRILEKYENGLL